MTDAAALGRLMLAFDGEELPEAMRRRLLDAPAAGVTLFRYRNIASAAQVRALTDAIQACAPPQEPYLVAIDQEGGQLRGLGPGSTAFPGNMALGAVDDPELTRRVGRAIGEELRAAGINVNYAPVADLASSAANPALGVRAFGDDPVRVAAHVGAMVEGLESAGVAATLKHFPGAGDATVDTHHALAAVARTGEELTARELVPFAAGLAAGASLVMAGHVAYPAAGAPHGATLSSAVLRGLLREQLGFRGVSISDAFDMDALAAGEARYAAAVEALDAGLDLILLGGRSSVPDFDAAVRTAARQGRPAAAGTATALGRIRALRRRLAGPASAPAFDATSHEELAGEVAQRSITAVTDRDRLLPLRPAAGERILVVMPRASDLTPADTSAVEDVPLAEAIRRRHAATESIVVSPSPTPEEVSAVREHATTAAVVVVGTLSASLDPSQAAMVDAILGTGSSTVTVALRTPWDLAAYPRAGTHLCTYSVVAASCEALAAVCFGEREATGRLPVAT